MSRIKSKNTRPELKLKKLLRGKGFFYQPKVYGNPDFINFKKRIVIFVDGCFWHGCPKCFELPKTNKSFWRKKINKNFLRDKEITFNYNNSGWKVIRIWEHSIEKNQFPEGLKR